MSETYTFNINTDFQYPDVNLDRLTAEIQSVSSLSSFQCINGSGDLLFLIFSTTLSTEAENDLNTVIGAHIGDSHNLEAVRHAKLAEIDENTVELVDNGFTFSGKQFSLSLAAQSKMTAAFTLSNDPYFTYPVYFNTIDDLDKLAIANSTVMYSFYLTAVGTCRAYIDGGTALKDAVRAATTIEEINAVQDNR